MIIMRWCVALLALAVVGLAPEASLAAVPVAANQNKATMISTSTAINLTNGASGGAATSAAVVSGSVVGGTLKGFPSTTVTFTPTKDYIGPASFQFTLSNASGKSNVATAVIGVVFRDCSTCPLMVVVPKGSFVMGQDVGAGAWEDSNELPRHAVKIAAAFAVGVYPVSQGQYWAVMGDDPSAFTRNSQRPADSVSWDDAMTFAAKLSTTVGKLYRLPSEAEWEYVARGGKQTPWFFSGSVADPGADCSAIPALLNQYAWTICNSNDQTHALGSLLPNPFGLFDIYGNVQEWVADCYNEDYMMAPADGSSWVASGCPARVLRGGSWAGIPYFARSASRSWDSPSSKNNDYGFRVVRMVAP